MNFKQFLFKNGTRRQRFYNKYRMQIPNVFTLGNALLGFLSLIFSANNSFIAAAYCILLSSVVDFLDGASARYLNAESSLGAQLDSLSDAISFCVAPAFLSYCWLSRTHFLLIFPAVLIFFLRAFLD